MHYFSSFGVLSFRYGKDRKASKKEKRERRKRGKGPYTAEFFKEKLKSGLYHLGFDVPD